ncbi:DUF2490 domain-containing protein [Flavobacteriaceae bacterium]|nr:DUF2490 domain-containing protein [Flavobacteriaceae bacterium]
MRKILPILIFFFFSTSSGHAQISKGKQGAWYIFIWNVNTEKSKLGFKGDIQYRNWNLLGDLEQLIIRGGITYPLKNSNLYFAYGNITSGKLGISKQTSHEDRLHQEITFVGKKDELVKFKHRIRFEERFFEKDVFRTRFRYLLSINKFFKPKKDKPRKMYLSFYDEILLNTSDSRGSGFTFFDTNRLYSAFGFILPKKKRLQLGYMLLNSKTVIRGQWQISFINPFL